MPAKPMTAFVMISTNSTELRRLKRWRQDADKTIATVLYVPAGNHGRHYLVATVDAMKMASGWRPRTMPRSNGPMGPDGGPALEIGFSVGASTMGNRVPDLPWHIVAG